MSSLINNRTTATYTKSQPNNRCRINCGLFYGTSHRALSWMTHCIHCLQTSLYLICKVKLKCCSENSKVVTYVHTYIHACTYLYTVDMHTHNADLNITMHYIVVMEVFKAKNDLAHVKLGSLLGKHAVLVKIELQVTSYQYTHRISTTKAQRLVVPLMRSSTW